MLKYYNAQLNALSPHAKRKVWIDGKLEALYGELKDLERKYGFLHGKRNAVQEERDGISFGFKGLGYAICGQRGKELRKKEAEIDSLTHQIDEIASQAGLIRREMKMLEEERESIRPQAGEFRRVLVQKRDAMRQLGLFTGEMLSLEQARQDMDKRIRHLTRTIESGDRIMDLMREISNNVNEAINQGQSDLFGCKTYEWGGGYAKHWKLRDAQKRFDRLQQMIEDFGIQLNGTPTEIEDISFELDKRTIAKDVMLDNIFTDRAVLMQIRESRAKFQTLCDQMRIVMQALTERKRGMEREKERMKKQLERLIEQAE